MTSPPFLRGHHTYVPYAHDFLESTVEAAIDDEVHDAVEDEEQVIDGQHANEPHGRPEIVTPSRLKQPQHWSKAMRNSIDCTARRRHVPPQMACHQTIYAQTPNNFHSDASVSHAHAMKKKGLSAISIINCT